MASFRLIKRFTERKGVNLEEAHENSVEQEVATQEADAIETQQEQAPPVDDRQEGDWRARQERNWRTVRQRMADLERENKEKEELLKKALELQKAHQVPEEEEEPDEEYIPKGKVKKLAKKEIEPLQKELESLKKELLARKQQELFQSLRTRYPDFDEVVNAETIALFEEKEPELADTIAGINDPYKIGMQSYKFIKSSGILGSVPANRRQKEADKMMEKNSKTVQSPQAYDKRPMAQAFQLTESEKSKLYEEMTGYAKMASAVPEMM